ncbi:MAG: DUF4173 domain-containing protein [Firmicutes bacterium]|nr:DUF4173 domain-containing protein [Bacillota bacterium]
MWNLVVYILILAILNSILFFDNYLGLNVILFAIPLLVFLFYVLKINKKINNKYGLLFMIPILILSCAYFVYDNIFNIFNLLVIPILYILMLIYTVKPTYNLIEIIKDGIYFVFKPFDFIGKFYNVIKVNLNKKIKLSKEIKDKIRSILIVIPIVIVVLSLLSTADMIFGNMFKGMFKFIDHLSIEDSIFRIIMIVVFFTYFGAFINYLLFGYEKEERNNSNIKVSSYTIKLLLCSLNIIYVIFDFIQIRSLLLHQVSSNINYAEYAREGFFQLMIISVINLVILLISKHSKENKFVKVMSVIMVLLTSIIICSSFIRMSMYEAQYGYTVLRLLVYVILITEMILLIPTVVYILKNKFNVLKYYLIIITIIYTLINLVSIDYVIAYRNINRYYDKNKIDMLYLENGRTDNIPLLIDLYNNTKENKLKEEIGMYLVSYFTSDYHNNIFEYNISNSRAHKLIIDNEYVKKYKN